MFTFGVGSHESLSFFFPKLCHDPDTHSLREGGNLLPLL